jgi:magnesium transporter
VAGSKDGGRREHGNLFELGQKLVWASRDIPREAIAFLGRPVRARRGPPRGAVPGAMVVPRDAPEPVIRVMGYDTGSLEELVVDDVDRLPGLLDRGRTTWIDVTGFGNQAKLEALSRVLGIHPLAMADVVHVPQRPKAELYDGRLLVIAQMAVVTEEGGIDIEQVGLVLGPTWVASFQESAGDVFDPLRARLRAGTSRVRQQGADFLLYALIDSAVDGYFPVIDALGGIVDALEEDVVADPNPSTLARIHATRRILLQLHRVQWRQRDAVSTLLRDEELPIGDAVKPYLRDTHDHAYQTLDAIETYRDMVVGLMDLHLSSASYRLNEVMKTLTIVATIFIPLTFMSGVYGMNFDYMPELRWHWGYPAFWVSMLALALALLWWFRRRGWLGTRDLDDG